MEDQKTTGSGSTENPIDSTVASTESGAGKSAPKSTETLFNQEDVNKFLAKERRAWERKAEQEKEELSKKYGETESSLSKLQKELEALRAIQDKTVEETKAEKAARLAAEAKIAEAEKRTSVLQTALKLGARPEAVGDISKLFTPPQDDKEIDKELEKFLKDRPYLLRDQNGQTKPVTGATNPSRGAAGLSWQHPLLKKPSSSIFGE